MDHRGELNRRLAESDGPLGVRDEDEQGTSYGPLWVADGDPRIFTEDAEFTVAQAREQALFWWAAAAAAERNRMERMADDVEHGDYVPIPGSLEVHVPLPEYVPVDRTGPAIRAALREVSPDELPEFEAEFHIALAEADDDFDVSRIDRVITHWWGIANMRVDPPTAAERELVEQVARGDFEGLQVEWRVYLIREGLGWSAVIPGTPIAADGATREEALDEMVDALRDYVESWNEYLRLAPNHAANKNLVDLIDGETDESLRRWVAAGDCGDAQREYDTSPVLRDALRRAREARSVKRGFRRRDE